MVFTSYYIRNPTTTCNQSVVQFIHTHCEEGSSFAHNKGKQTKSAANSRRSTSFTTRTSSSSVIQPHSSDRIDLTYRDRLYLSGKTWAVWNARRLSTTTSGSKHVDKGLTPLKLPKQTITNLQLPDLLWQSTFPITVATIKAKVRLPRIHSLDLWSRTWSRRPPNAL